MFYRKRNQIVLPQLALSEVNAAWTGTAYRTFQSACRENVSAIPIAQQREITFRAIRLILR